MPNLELYASHHTYHYFTAKKTMAYTSGKC